MNILVNTHGESAFKVSLLVKNKNYILFYLCAGYFCLMKFAKKVIFIFALITCFGFFVNAQSPNLKCLGVDSVGNIQISWEQPADTCNFFTQYYIYYSSNSGGPFVLIDSITDFLTNTYYHVGANADVGNCYYYVSSISGCVNNISDTLKSIFLSINNTVQGTTSLNWNNTHNPVVSTGSGMYYIYRENSLTGSLQLVDSAYQLNFYIDSFTVCNDTINYQIVMIDSSGCINTSNVVELYPDGLQPGIVTIDSVTVDVLTGFGAIGWQQGDASDIMGYIIYVANNFGGWDSIDFVFGATNTYYLDNLSKVDTNAIVYNVVAIDSCGNKGVFGAGHTTMFLWATLDTCLGEATLSWNEYYLWSSGISEYDIYISENGSPYTILGTSNTTQFVHTGLVKASTYCYYIRAKDGTGLISSSSNVMCSYKDIISSANISLTLTVEAHDSVKNILYWNEEPVWGILIGGYAIYRSFDGGSFVLIGFQPFGTSVYYDSLIPLENFRTGKGEFCYYVVPVKSSVGLYGCIDTSNIECVTQFPKFVVPNTFTPNGDGRNDVFLPIRIFIADNDYLFIIYNRWGQKLFETSNPSDGWDGTLKGAAVQNDAYVYYVSFKIRGDEQIVKAGTVMLLR